jgi:hypothetical protein
MTGMELDYFDSNVTGMQSKNVIINWIHVNLAGIETGMTRKSK